MLKCSTLEGVCEKNLWHLVQDRGQRHPGMSMAMVGLQWKAVLIQDKEAEFGWA